MGGGGGEGGVQGGLWSYQRDLFRWESMSCGGAGGVHIRAGSGRIKARDGGRALSPAVCLR